MKRSLLIALIVLLMPSFSSSQNRPIIGLSFSDFATQRGPRERGEMSRALRAGGYEVIWREANHDEALQAKQLREMAGLGASVMIVAEDGRSIAPVVDEIAGKASR
jgi:D-xylose transport system substrate-binding protein